MTGSSGGIAAGARLLEEYEDRELVVMLQEQGCTGPLWLRTVDVLASYSWRSFERVLRAGTLTNRTRNRGRTVWLSPHEWHDLLRDVGQREDLFFAALEKQVALFAERTSAGYGWIEGGRMSLRDYFFNGVLLQLANPIRGWRRARARDATITALSPDELTRLAGSEASWGPEERFLAGESAAAVVALLDDADPQLREAVLLRADTGAQWKHIAKEVGLTEARLESLRRRFRESLTQARITEGDEGS